MDPLSESLIGEGIVDEETLREVKERARGRSLIVELFNYASPDEDRIARLFVEKFSIPKAALVEIPPEAIHAFTEETAMKYLCMPFDVEGRRLKVAMVDPLDLKTIQDISFITGRMVEPYVATRSEILDAIHTCFKMSGDLVAVMNNLAADETDDISFLEDDEEFDEDPDAFFEAVADGKEVLAENAVTGEGLPTYGTQVLMNVINSVGGLPARNMRDVGFEGAENISGEAMHEPRASDGKPNLTTNGACFGCTIACGRISSIDKTHFSIKDKADQKQYQGSSGGLEYEAAWSLGADTGVDDLDALTYVNFVCNEDGFDPISFGCTVAAAMELFEAGKITTEDTGGIELKFGSAEALVAVTELLVTGEGFGADIALGSKRLCEKYGEPELSMSVKGLEFPAYDPRGFQGIGLNYATSNRGACHVRGYTIASEVLGIPVKTEQTETDGKPELVKAFQDATALVDSAGICLFTTFAWGMENIAPQIDAACEGDWSVDKCLEAGERIWNMERLYNNEAGFTADDDTLPKRLLKEAIKSGPTKGEVNRLGEMLPRYYEIRGWTADGKPTPETLSRLGL